MLIQRRREDDWIIFTHEGSGDTVRVRLTEIRGGTRGSVKLVIDDPSLRFEVGCESAPAS